MCCNVCVVLNGVMSVNQLLLLSGSCFVFGVWRSNWFLLLVVCTEVVSGTRGSCLRTALSPSPERTGSREEEGTGQVALRGHSSVKPMSFKEGKSEIEVRLPARKQGTRETERPLSRERGWDLWCSARLPAL
uniref:Uncharacterized protein n=1 Tax=Pipistrellus kuhlii TaxID=59472 RepID=A0A7J7RNN1_PIPKU|nr:hypothetical protein mPipKuh1_010387 [Pipistrellus kuhlii]